MYCSNYVDFWLIVLAAWSCGGCVMPVNCELEVEHLEQEMTEAKVKVSPIEIQTGFIKNLHLNSSSHQDHGL